MKKSPSSSAQLKTRQWNVLKPKLIVNKTLQYERLQCDCQRNENQTYQIRAYWQYVLARLLHLQLDNSPHGHHCWFPKFWYVDVTTMGFSSLNASLKIDILYRQSYTGKQKKLLVNLSSWLCFILLCMIATECQILIVTSMISIAISFVRQLNVWITRSFQGLSRLVGGLSTTRRSVSTKLFLRPSEGIEVLIIFKVQ